MQEPLAVFRCPSDVGPVTNTQAERMPDDTSGTGANKPWAVATSNYLACNSSGYLRNADGIPNADANGLFMRGGGNDSPINFASILDGLSVTIAVGERAFKIKNPTGTHDCWAGIVFGARGDAGNSNDGIASCLAALRQKINQTPECRQAFSSLHPGGAQFVFADGSTHFLSESVDHNLDAAVNSTLEYLAARNDGEPVKVP